MDLATFFSAHPWVIILAVIWTLYWKGVALWRAARNQSIVWFVILLIVNTLGIVEIIYIFGFSKKTGAGVETSMPQPIAMPEAQEPEKIVLDTKSEETKEDEVVMKAEEPKSDLDDPIQKS